MNITDYGAFKHFPCSWYGIETFGLRGYTKAVAPFGSGELAVALAMNLPEATVYGVAPEGHPLHTGRVFDPGVVQSYLDKLVTPTIAGTRDYLDRIAGRLQPVRLPEGLVVDLADAVWKSYPHAELSATAGFAPLHPALRPLFNIQSGDRLLLVNTGDGRKLRDERLESFFLTSSSPHA